jgi:hypothetical protein
MHQFQPFLHADEAKPSAFLCRFAVKTCAGVSNRKMNLIRRSPQSYFDVPYPTVFYRIVEGLLHDAEEAKRNVRRQRAGQIVASEVNPRGGIVTEGLNRGEGRAFVSEQGQGGDSLKVLESCPKRHKENLWKTRKSKFPYTLRAPSSSKTLTPAVLSGFHRPKIRLPTGYG